jgi:diguanylate cyclase (GGDEF)-like protein
MNVKSRLKNYSKPLLVVSSFVLALVIGIIRYLTGPEWALSALYLFLIILVTWKVGTGTGILISFTSAISWLIADLMMINSFSNPLIPYLNETLRLVVFLILTYIISILKISIDKHKELSRTDHLTGIANRRAFIDLANLELNKARRYQVPISILYMDIDNFKFINDHFGHHIGDRLLCSVAKTIKDHIRAIDVTARFGGDEFGILLAETGSGEAALVAGKLKEKLEELAQQYRWPVTFSTGVVTFERIPASVDELIDAADAQMYLAKQNGKNQTRHQTMVGHESAFPTVVNL